MNEDKVKVTIFNKSLQETLHATHLLMLLDNMYKYEMDPTRSVGTTERTRDGGWMDRWTDRRMDWPSETTQQLCCAGGIKTEFAF